jgi:hypothetical protein
METETRGVPVCVREVVAIETLPVTSGIEVRQPPGEELALADPAESHIILTMPEPITLYRVFLAAPSDVTDELVVVEKGCFGIGIFSMGSSWGFA